MKIATELNAKAEALRTQRDFFKAIDMDVAADHCEQAALGWDSAVDDACKAMRNEEQS